MARRGSLVGDAYVRIHADSSAIDRELRRELTAAAKKDSKELIANWDKAIRERAKQRKWQARSALLDGIVGGKKDWDRQFKNSGLASLDDFVKTVEAQMKAIAKKGKSFKLLPQSLADFEDWAKDAKIEDALRKMQQAVVDQDKAWRSYGENVAFAKKKQDEVEKSLRKSEKALLDQDRAFNTYLDNVDPVRRMTKAMKEQEKAFASYSKNIRAAMDFNPDTALSAEMRKAAKKANEELIRAIVGGKPEWDRQFKKSGLASTKDFAKKVRQDIHNMATAAEAAGTPFRGLREALDSIDRWSRAGTGTRIDRFFRTIRSGRGSMSKFADLIGKAFGKGSRNNFFNFTGTVAAGIAGIGTAIAGAGIDTLIGTFKTLQTFGSGGIGLLKGIGQLFSGGGFSGITTSLFDLGNGVKDLAKGLGTTLLSAAQNVLPVLAAIGAAISIATIAIPPLLALIGNLAAILVAVAGTIGIGLVGALLAVAPLGAAIAAGFAAAIFMVQGFGKETKAVKKAIKPLSDAWSALKKKLQGPILVGVAKEFAKLAPVLKNFVTPLLVAITESIGQAVGRFGKIMDSPGMKKFLKVWEEILPVIFDNLAATIANVAAAVIAFFTPILPFAMTLSENLEAISQTFLEWTQSAEGQNAIADFMRTAWERAGDLWDIIVLIGQAIGALFTSGDATAGDTIIDAIKTKMEEFVTWLNDPATVGALETWFTNGLDTAKSLWQSITDISNALKTVDWEDASRNINTVIEFIGTLGAAILLATTLWNAWTGSIGASWHNVASILSTVYNTAIGPVLSLMLGGVAAVQRAIALMFRALSNVPGFGWAKDAADKMYAAADATDALSAKIRKVPDAFVTVNVGLSGPGAKLIQQSMARRRPDIVYGAAAGGILDSPTFVRSNVIAGEAGREAIVPLDRPLSQVDPSVRALAAFAQGQTSLKSGGMVGGSGTTIEAGAIVVTSPYADPALVAESVFDHLAAAAR